MLLLLYRCFLTPDLTFGQDHLGSTGLLRKVVYNKTCFYTFSATSHYLEVMMPTNTLPCLAGIATTVLLTSLVPETSFQSTTSNGAASTWCIRPLLEQGLMLRFTDGCRIFLASLVGQLVILLVALIVNNLHPTSGYPKRWS